MKTPIYHCDGGAFIEPPNYKFHDAYFSVLNDKGKLIKFDKKLGDIYSGLAEYLAIKWVLDHKKKRPIIITTDCQTAIAWVHKGGDIRTKTTYVPPLNHSLEGVTIQYQHNNLADIWNALNYSPKPLDKMFYINRWKELQKKQKLY